MATPNPSGDRSGQPPWGGQPPGYPPRQPPQIPPPWGYPHQPHPGYPSPPGYPPAGFSLDPQAPFGRDPKSGAPLSDKSAVTAGCLQLFFGFLGIGRFYIGSNSIGAAQLCVGLFGMVFTLFCLIGVPVLLGALIWGIVDAVLMFTGGVADEYGRKLR
ncbi:TM2 domain protein [Mycobacterium basiliense]|uniref:TM2 domain protein n=1 Tax=Mycobacterium basiliense TaxID=2094119 RepID=A0A447GKY9_9MYCO|nr:TM2 domain-containing protein [Mycobacterium basiliense]VDM91108.1 TM2 domain protein [Mycobacterium basiliense]